MIGLALTQHKSTRGTPLSFAERPYLVELYADARKFDSVVMRKAVQTGISEWLIQVMFDSAGWRGRIVAYVMPTYHMRNRFVQQRVNPLLTSVGAYRDRCPVGPVGATAEGGKGNLSLKRFGKGALLFLGAASEIDFVEFSADVLIVDEYDLCTPSNLARAADRLRESPYPQRFYIGNPGLPRVGISRKYDESDQRQWFHRCPKCGERQPLDWFEQVVERDNGGRWVPRDKKRWLMAELLRPLCVRCKEFFDRPATGGMWVPAAPSSPVRGYTMSRLDVLSDPLLDLYKEWISAQGSPEEVRAFYTSVLGLPFEFEGTRLTVSHLEDAMTGQADMDWTGGEAYKDEVVVAGVDVGSVLNVTISVVTRDELGNPIRTAVYVGAPRRFEEVEDLLLRYRVDICVVDSRPETRKAQELRDTFVNNGKCDVWLCQFHPTPRVGHQKYGMRLDYRSRVVTVSRTPVFDVSFADIAEGRRFFPRDSQAVLGWSEQMRAPVRITDTAKQRIIWTEGSRPDHYRLADVYDRVAADLLDMGGSFFTLE